jgi:hypothetical protein
MIKFRAALVGFVVSALLAAGQESTVPAVPPTPPTTVPPRAQFFAGSVVDLNATQIKVSRTLVGHPTESRSFTITPATKMSKSAIKQHTRVTVRYRHLPEGGDIALEIQPQPVIARTPKA